MKARAAFFTFPKLAHAVIAPLIAWSLVPTTAHALITYQTVWDEHFDNIASFEGAPITTTESSEYWNPAHYYSVNNGANDWSFANGAAFVTNGQGNGAIVLNESGPDGSAASLTQPLASIKLTGLVIGYNYYVGFSYWGDNFAAAGNSYDLTTYLNGTQIKSLPTASVDSGSLTAPHFSYFYFTANTTTIDLGFGQIATGMASPILDDISISLAQPFTTQDPLHSIPSVPEPNAITLMLLGGLIMTARWITEASRRKRADR